MPKLTTIDSRTAFLAPELKPFHLFTEGPFKLRVPGDYYGAEPKFNSWVRIWGWSTLLWLPFLLSGDFKAESFLPDLPAHVRFLVSIPLLVYSGCLSDVRIGRAVGHFPIDELDSRREKEFIERAVSMRDSVWLNGAVLLIAVGLQILRFKMGWGTSNYTFHAIWADFVGKFIAQLVVLIWVSKVLIWTYVLWCYSRLKLNILLAHPDHRGGLGFLNWIQSSFSMATVAFASIMVANLVSASTVSGQRVAVLTSETLEVMLLFLGVTFVIFLGPLLFFTPQLCIAKNRKRMEYTRFADKVLHAYEQKWIAPSRARSALRESPLTEDISFVCDLRDADDQAQEMLVIIPDVWTLRKFLVACALPIVPVLLTEIPGHVWVELAKKLFI